MAVYEWLCCCAVSDITIGFSQDLYDVPEDQPFVNITVQVLGGGPLEREVTVTLDITAGTAMCKQQY